MHEKNASVREGAVPNERAASTGGRHAVITRQRLLGGEKPTVSTLFFRRKAYGVNIRRCSEFSERYFSPTLSEIRRSDIFLQALFDKHDGTTAREDDVVDVQAKRLCHCFKLTMLTPSFSSSSELSEDEASAGRTQKRHEVRSESRTKKAQAPSYVLRPKNILNPSW